MYSWMLHMGGFCQFMNLTQERSVTNGSQPSGSYIHTLDLSALMY